MSDIPTQIEEVHKILGPVHMDVMTGHDFRVVIAVHLSLVSGVMQAGISAGVLTPESAASYFRAALETALVPRETKPHVGYINEGPGRMQ